MSMVSPEEDETFGTLNTLVPTLGDMDERGLVLSLAAFAEEALGHLLKTFMLPNQSAVKLLTGFNAPFGTFSTRIKGCHALGLIEDIQAADLEILRKVRNEFAHSWALMRLDNQRNRTLVERLSYPLTRHSFPPTAREKLVLSISFLLGELRSNDVRIREADNVAHLVGTRLISGSMDEVPEQIIEMEQHVISIDQEWSASVGERRKWLKGQAWYWINRAPIISRAANTQQAENVRRLAHRLVALTGLLPNEIATAV
jgi:hypothetical protein